MFAFFISILVIKLITFHHQLIIQYLFFTLLFTDNHKTYLSINSLSDYFISENIKCAVFSLAPIPPSFSSSKS